MKLRFQIFLLLLYVTSLCFGQQTQVEPYFVKSRNFDIKFQDTVIEASIFTLPTGEFSFDYGHDIVTQNFAWYRLTGKRKNTRTTKDSLIKSEKSALALMSYFPMLHQDSSKVLIAQDYGVTWSPHHFHELRYTYVLNQSGFEPLFNSRKDSTIRIVFKELGVNHAEYEIFTVDLSGKKFLFHRKKVKHTYSESFETLEEVKGEVKKRKAIRRFYDEFNKYDLSDSMYFVKYDGGHHSLIEFKTSEDYTAILRPHVNSRGKADDKALTWTMYDLLGWAIRNNKKEEKKLKMKK